MYKYRFPASDGKITIEIAPSDFKKAEVVQWISYFDYVEVVTKNELPDDFNKYKV